MSNFAGIGAILLSLNMTTLALAVALADASQTDAQTVTTVQILKDEYGRMTTISKQQNALYGPASTKLTVKEYPQYVVEHAPIQAARIIELKSSDSQAIEAWLKDHQVAPMTASLDQGQKDEVRTIVNSGPANNRIDLVFMGDGYTVNEREKFFADITRLVNDMFVGKTFASYLPVFNVHAVFRASNQTGIGRGSAIDTAYGLYREGETLRAIFPSKQSAIRDSCRQAPGCDYPVVIANDPYYGGLGGEFAISTSSPTSGTVVLRHELGHNFGRVGEEYDGGGYFGANYSSSYKNPEWAHWATDRSGLRAEPMVARYIDWPWHKLDKGPFSINMNSDGKYSRTSVRLSASGIETPDTLAIKIDGQDVAFTSPNRLDRSFINIEMPGLESGRHTMTFTENVQDHNNWVSSLTVHEYADDFHDHQDFVGAFPNFDQFLNLAGFRPTNESCLMRDMTHEFFCPVCQENNWAHFFDKIDLIDSATATVNGNRVSANVKTIRLGQYRSDSKEANQEKLEITWKVDGQDMPQFRDQLSIDFEFQSKPKSVDVDVRFVTPEIRQNVVTSHKTLSI